MKKQLRKQKPIFIGVLILFLLFLYGNIFSRENLSQGATENEFDTLSHALSQIEGVGKVVIFYRQVPPSKDDALAHFFSLQGQKERMTEASTGILIVAEGGGSPTIQNLLSKTIATVLQIPEHKIVIMEMKQEGDIE